MPYGNIKALPAWTPNDDVINFKVPEHASQV